MKKFMASVLIFVTMLNLGGISVVAANSASAYDNDFVISNDMEPVDVIVAGYFYAGDIDSNRHRSDSDVITVTNIVPLYIPEGDVVAYYVTYSSGIYAIVNNNIANPTVIEFGEGKQEAIEEILQKYDEPHIIYNNPFSVYEVSCIESLPTTNKYDEIKNIYDYYPELNDVNPYLAEAFDDAKTIALNTGAVNSGTKSILDPEYGFLNPGEMPTASFTHDLIQKAGSIDWAVMRDYSDFAEDHCAATTITNVALYYAENGYDDLLIDGSKDRTFEEVYEIFGKGPILSLTANAQLFFSNLGYDLKHESVNNAIDIREVTEENHPFCLMVGGLTIEWHWIVGVGWRQYTESKDFYVRLVNNWDDTINKFYKINSGAQWLTADVYWIDD